MKRIRRKSSAGRRRRGAIVVLTAFVLVGLLAVAGLLLSLSYVELCRTELQAATDAAARSAVIRLVVTQDEEAGREGAVEVASLYRVAGRAFSIRPEDIVYGNAAAGVGGAYAFEAGGHPTNAARVAGRKRHGAAAGPVDLPFGQFMGVTQFETETPATATRLDYDICLVLDRSGSMAWDLSHQRFSYPWSKVGRPLAEQYFTPPDPNGSRWGVLSASVTEFLEILRQRDVSARVGLATFASDYSFGNYESRTVTLESDLTGEYSAIESAVEAVGAKPLIGDTNIGAGLRQAETVLTTSGQARTRTAHGTVLLFSDGIVTEGEDPVEVAGALYSDHGIIVHCVTFGAEVAARQTMDDIARVAGKGLSLHADSAYELLDSFRTIANSIPVIVTQ